MLQEYSKVTLILPPFDTNYPIPSLGAHIYLAAKLRVLPLNRFRDRTIKDTMSVVGPILLDMISLEC